MSKVKTSEVEMAKGKKYRRTKISKIKMWNALGVPVGARGCRFNLPSPRSRLRLCPRPHPNLHRSTLTPHPTLTHTLTHTFL